MDNSDDRTPPDIMKQLRGMMNLVFKYVPPEDREECVWELTVCRLAMGAPASEQEIDRMFPQNRREVIVEALKLDGIPLSEHQQFIEELASIAKLSGIQLREIVQDTTPIPPSVARRRHADPFTRHIDEAVRHWDAMGGQMRRWISGFLADDSRIANPGDIFDRLEAVGPALREIHNAATDSMAALSSGYKLSAAPASCAEGRTMALEAMLLYYNRFYRSSRGGSPSTNDCSPARSIGAEFFGATLSAAGQEVELTEVGEEPVGFDVAWRRATDRLRRTDGL